MSISVLYRRRRRTGTGGAAGVPPEYSSSEVGDVGTTTIEVMFSENVNATDYADGVTIKFNAVSQNIDSGTRQGNKALVYFVIDTAADVNDAITFEYDDDVGDYEDDAGNPMLDIAAETVTNYIGSHLYLDTADDSIWIGAA